jgi:hypothetical protein
MNIPRIPVDEIAGIIRTQTEKPQIIFVLNDGRHEDIEFQNTDERDRTWGNIEHNLKSRELDFVYHRNVCIRPSSLVCVEPVHTTQGKEVLHFCFSSGVEFNQHYADRAVLSQEYAQLATTLAFAQYERTNCVSFTTH